MIRDYKPDLMIDLFRIGAKDGSNSSCDIQIKTSADKVCSTILKVKSSKQTNKMTNKCLNWVLSSQTI